MTDQKIITKEVAVSQRSDCDRRVDEVEQSLGGRERRHIVERRLPIVDESGASFSDWVKSMVIFLAKKRKKAKVKSIVRQAGPKQR